MSMLSSASGKSVARGYNYYTDKKVIRYRQISDNEYSGKVSGSNSQIYDVQINLRKPKTSTCTCEFAKDRLVICKHMIALFFTVFPEEAEQYIKDVEEYWDNYEKEQIRRTDRMINYIKKLKKSQLQHLLINILESNEQLKNDFIDYIID